MNVRIRYAELPDIEYLVSASLKMQEHHEDLRLDLWRYSENADDYLNSMFNKRILDESGMILVATGNDDEIVGFVSGRIVEHENRLPEISGHISRLYVEQPYRRRGVATMLVKELCDFFSKNRVEDVTVRFVDGNELAESFWHSLGFNTRIITAGVNLSGLKSRLTP